MPKNKSAKIEFSLLWKSPAADHKDTYQILDINFESDIFPKQIKDQLFNLALDEGISFKMHAKELLGNDYSSDNVITFDSNLFETQFKNHFSPAILYRFYPNAIAWQGLKTDNKDYTPFRLISKNSDSYIADKNHPLAKYYVTLTAKKLDESNEVKNKRPALNIGQFLASKGPGMQAPFEFGDPIFFDNYPFIGIEKKNISKPNIDTNAIEQLEKLYSKLLPTHSKILDILSDSSSFLGSDYQTGLLTGIGTDERNLSENKRLDTYTLQDLNDDTTLPFKTNSFDDAICTLSIDYLRLQPRLRGSSDLEPNRTQEGEPMSRCRQPHR